MFYENIDGMLKKTEIINPKEFDSLETFYNEVNDIVTRRWNEITTPLHILAYALQFTPKRPSF